MRNGRYAPDFTWTINFLSNYLVSPLLTLIDVAERLLWRLWCSPPTLGVKETVIAEFICVLSLWRLHRGSRGRRRAGVIRCRRSKSIALTCWWAINVISALLRPMWFELSFTLPSMLFEHWEKILLRAFQLLFFHNPMYFSSCSNHICRPLRATPYQSTQILASSLGCHAWKSSLGPGSWWRAFVAVDWSGIWRRRQVEFLWPWWIGLFLPPFFSTQR